MCSGCRPVSANQLELRKLAPLAAVVSTYSRLLAVFLKSFILSFSSLVKVSFSLPFLKANEYTMLFNVIARILTVLSGYSFDTVNAADASESDKLKNAMLAGFALFLAKSQPQKTGGCES